MKTQLLTAGLILASAISQTVVAKDVTVKVTNLTAQIYFTPLIIAAHSKNLDFYELSMPASFNLQKMAEGGDISGLVADAESYSANYVANPASGRLAPGASTTATISITNKRNRYLSVAAMLLPTNDGFVAEDSLELPTKPGVYTYYLNGYDAGTEANDELVTGGGAPGVRGIPGDPGGHSGTGGSGVIDHEINPVVHVHPNNLGDFDNTTGISDLNSRVHRWLNPVAELEITISCGKNESGNSQRNPKDCD